MHDDPDAPANTVTTGAADPAAEARALEVDGVAAFSGLSNELSALRDRHAALGAALQRFGERATAAAGGAVPLDTLSEAIRGLGQTLQDYIYAVGGVGIRSNLRRANGHLAAIGQTAKTLTAIGTLTRTTSAALGVEALTRYVHDLRTTADRIGQASHAVEGQLLAFDQRIRGALDRCASAEAAVRSLDATLDGERGRLAALDAEETRVARDVSLRATRLAEKGRTHLKAFVTAMQFADRLGQRLDHLSQMLEMREPSLAPLAARHARSCAAAIAETADAVTATMSALDALARDGAALLSEGDVVEAIGRTQAARAEIAQTVNTEMADLRALMDLLAQGARHAAKTSEHARSNFDMLEEGAKRLSVASINSMLLSSRAGDGGGPLVALSGEVRQAASECLAAVGGGRAALNLVLDAASSSHDALFEASDAVRAAIEDQARATEARSGRLDDIRRESAEARTAAAEIARGIAVVATGMTALTAVGSRLEALADGLAEGSAPAPDPALLARVWDLYTMDEERLVHAELYAPTGPQLAAPTGADDLDDVFF